MKRRKYSLLDEQWGEELTLQKETVDKGGGEIFSMEGGGVRKMIKVHK